MPTDDTPPVIDPFTAHPARRYNYWLGGKDHFATDRASGDAVEKIFPGIRTAAVENRLFLHRAVRHLTEEHGVRQFLDIGTGLPTADNTHEVAQRYAPDARIVYVDNDPLVLVHARALLTSHPDGVTAYIDADVRYPDTILNDPTLRDTLDLTQPIALLLVAVLHFLTDTDDPHAVVRALMDALAPGSYLMLTHATADLLPPATAHHLAAGDIPGRGDFTTRTRQQIDHFFDGLDLLQPGLQIVSAWHPDPGSPQTAPGDVSVYGGVARKPVKS
jgi:hypothetical protein